MHHITSEMLTELFQLYLQLTSKHNIQNKIQAIWKKVYTAELW